MIGMVTMKLVLKFLLLGSFLNCGPISHIQTFRARYDGKKCPDEVRFWWGYDGFSTRKVENCGRESVMIEHDFKNIDSTKFIPVTIQFLKDGEVVEGNVRMVLP
jgi:hypothetical protein